MNAEFHMGKNILTAKDEAEASEGNEWTCSEDLMLISYILCRWVKKGRISRNYYHVLYLLMHSDLSSLPCGPIRVQPDQSVSCFPLLVRSEVERNSEYGLSCSSFPFYGDCWAKL